MQTQSLDTEKGQGVQLSGGALNVHRPGLDFQLQTSSPPPPPFLSLSLHESFACMHDCEPCACLAFVEVRRTVLSPLALELGRVVSWALGIEAGSPSRASALNH